MGCSECSSVDWTVDTELDRRGDEHSGLEHLAWGSNNPFLELETNSSFYPLTRKT